MNKINFQNARFLLIFISFVYFCTIFSTIFVATTNSIQNSPFLFYNFCTTPECKEVGKYGTHKQCQHLETHCKHFSSGSHIDYALNKSISPCDDFYGFSCGGWISKTPRPSHEPVWSYWQSIGSRINERLDAVLQSQSSGDDDAFSKAQLLYRTCLKVGGIERSYLKQLRYVVNKLGGWPLSTYRAVEDYQWILEIVRVVKSFGSYPILKIFPEIDYTNTTRHVLYVSTLCNIIIIQRVFYTVIVRRVFHPKCRSSLSSHRLSFDLLMDSPLSSIHVLGRCPPFLLSGEFQCQIWWGHLFGCIRCM